MVALNNDDFEPSAEAIAFVEHVLGRQGRPEVVMQLVDALRGQLDGINTGEPDLSAFEHLKSIIDTASALRQYAKRAMLDLTTCNYAAELQLRAERKAGQWLTKHLDEQ
jgi:hypothetical protein